MMETNDIQNIRAKVKQAISQVTGIAVDQIADNVSYEQGLGLDSLSVLEIAVSVETEFKFQASDEELSSIRTVEDTVELIRRRTCAEVA
jgi:acyl carrier protein